MNPGVLLFRRVDELDGNPRVLHVRTDRWDGLCGRPRGAVPEDAMSEFMSENPNFCPLLQGIRCVCFLV